MNFILSISSIHIMVNYLQISILLRIFINFNSFFSYFFSVAPYVNFKVNPVVSDDTSNMAHKDAVFFSMHKLLGGVQTPGKALFQYFLCMSSLYLHSFNYQHHICFK